MKSDKIKQIQLLLEQDVRDKLHGYALVKWSNGLGSIHIYGKLQNIDDHALKLSHSYGNYYKTKYTIDRAKC